MDNLITDYSTNEPPNIVCSELLYHGINYKKVNVYNKSINSPLQKIWLRMPKMKIFKPMFNLPNDGKSIPLTVLLSPNTNSIKKFRLFIKKLEKKIISQLDLDTDYQIKSSVKITDNFPDTFTIKMPYTKVDGCYEFAFHIFRKYLLSRTIGESPSL